MPWGSMGEIWAEVGLNYAGLSQGMRDATAQVRTFDREINSSFKAIATNIGDSLSEAGRSLSIGITVPLTAFGGLAAKMSADFETAMANVWTITDISRQELEGFGREIEALSTRVPQSAKQLADGLYDAISSGIRDVGDAIGVVEIAAKAAQAGMSDTATAVDALTSVLNSYGLAADQAGVITDMMFRTVDRGKITFGELAGSIGQVISTAATAQVSFEEVAAAYATLTRGGIAASEASTAINQAILGIISPSKQAADYAKALGIEFDATALASKGLAGVLEDIYEATGGNIDAITTLFPNVRSLKGVLGLLRNEMQDYVGDLNQMAMATGATEAAFAKQMETSAAKASLFKNEVAALTRSLGNELWPILISIMDALKPVIHAFTELPTSVKEAAVAWGLFAVALGPVMSGLGALIGFLTGPAGIVLAISAVVAGIYGWVSASRDIEGQIDRQVSSARRVINEAMEQARAYGEQSNQLDKLIREYEKLEGKPDKSEQEHERLRQVIDAIVQLAPQAVTGYDDMGKALIDNAEAAKRVREELWQLRKEQLEIAAMRAEYELPMLEEQLQLLEPQFARTKRELDEIAPRYFKMREVVQEITRAATSAQKEQILQAAILEGIFDEISPPATQFAVMEQRYNKLYSVFTELSSALFKARGGVIELKNAQQELGDWLARKPGETVVAAAKSAAKTAKETVDTITEEELSEFEKFGKKVAGLSRDAFGALQDEWVRIAEKLKSTDPAEVSWAEQRARALLNAIHGAIAQFEGDWIEAAKAASLEVKSGYESIKEKVIEGQTELAKALSEFRHQIAIGEFVGVDAQLSELERIKGAYEGTAEEIQRVDEQLYQLREQRRSRAVRDALSQYQFEAELYKFKTIHHVLYLDQLLELDSLSAGEREEIKRKLALYEARLKEEAIEDEEAQIEKQKQLIADWNEFFVTSGQKARQDVLREAVASAEAELQAAMKAGEGISRAALKVEQAKLELREQERSDAQSQYNFLVSMGALTTAERIAQIQTWLEEEQENSEQWRALKLEEAELIKQLYREQAEDFVSQLGSVNRASLEQLQVWREELTNAHEGAVALGKEGAEAASIYHAALEQVVVAIDRITGSEKRWLYEHDMISADAYLEYLRDLQAGFAEFTTDWSSLQTEIERVEKEQLERRKSATNEAVAQQLAQADTVAESNLLAAISMLIAWRDTYAAMGDRGKEAFEKIEAKLKEFVLSHLRASAEVETYLAGLEKSTLAGKLKALDDEYKAKAATGVDLVRLQEWYHGQLRDLTEAELSITTRNVDRMSEAEVYAAQKTLDEILPLIQERVGQESEAAKLIIAIQEALSQRLLNIATDASKKYESELLQFRRRAGLVTFEEEIQRLQDIADVDSATREERLKQAQTYYNTVSSLIIESTNEELEALKTVLETALETFAAMGEAGEEMVLVISAALGEVDQKLIAKTDSWAATLAQSFAESLGELGSLVTAFRKGMEDSGGDPLAAAMAVFVELLKKSKAFAVLLDVLNPLVQTLADTVGAVLEPMIPLVMVLSEILTPALRGIAKVFTWVADIVVEIWNALANTINFILGWLGVNIPTISPTWREDSGLAPKPEEDDKDKDAGGRRGTQISEITGPTRDLLIETLRPLTVLDSLPIYAIAMETAIYEMRDAFLAYVGVKAATEAGMGAIHNEYHISTINIYSSGQEDFDQLMSSLNRRAEIALLGSGA